MEQATLDFTAARAAGEQAANACLQKARGAGTMRAYELGRVGQGC